MIREFRRSDTDAVIKIWLDASIIAHNFIEKDFWISKTDDMKNIYIPGSETYVYENSSGICGFFSLNKNSLAAIFVTPAQQGNGIGRQMIRKAMELRNSLNLTVYTENSGGISFYKKAGFYVVKENVDINTGHQELLMEWSSE